MKRLAPIVAVFCLWGCAGQPTPGHALYTPGDKRLLVARVEILDRSTGSSEEHIVSVTPGGKSEDRLVQRTQTPQSSYNLSELEMPLDVAAPTAAGQTPLAIRVRRYRLDYRHKGDGQEHIESFDTANPQAATQPGQMETMKGALGSLKAEFSVLVDAGGKVVEFDARGPGIESTKKELAQKTATPEEKMLALLVSTPGPGIALLEAPAYLPPADARVGQQWTVTREKVYPTAPYHFYMFTNGAWCSSERSVCTVQSVEPTLAGRIVTVAIAGRRFPDTHEPSMPRRVDYITTTGRLRFNLDTGEIPELRIETTPHFPGAEDRLVRLTFTDTIRLEKRP